MGLTKKLYEAAVSTTPEMCNNQTHVSPKAPGGAPEVMDALGLAALRVSLLALAHVGILVPDTVAGKLTQP